MNEDRDVDFGAIMNLLPIRFPTETERIQSDVADARDWTVEQRLRALLGLVSAVGKLDPSGGGFSQDRLRIKDKDEWQRCMRDFIQQQLASRSR